MKAKVTSSVSFSGPVLAIAVALALSGPVYATDPTPTNSPLTADRTTVSEVKPADNTARNARDVTGDKVTPLDQSHAVSDVELTRSIRKAMVDDATLGTNAQNVKVITVDGKVTLRGPVATTAEQARIVAIATKAAGPDRVLNELEVIKR